MGMFDRRQRREYTKKRDFGVLFLRMTTGGLLAGHGAQKLFGSFGGYGLEGTSGWLESMGFKPGKQWAVAAGTSEFGGGLMTAAGLFHPVGPIATMGSMIVAARTAHTFKPIWVTEGGAELPVTNLAIALALSLVGPGRYSLDHMLGIRVPDSLAMAAAGALVLGVVASETVKDETPPEQTEETGQQMAVEGDEHHA